jgi:flagellar basal-body rod protein FlgB
MKFFNNPTMGLLEKSLNVSTLRHNIISNNIANAETPGFKRADVRFEAELVKAMDRRQSQFVGNRTNSGHFIIGKKLASKVEPQMVRETGYSMNNYNNNVDLDHEMSQLAKNSLRYNVLIQQMNHKLALYKTAIQNGGRA